MKSWEAALGHGQKVTKSGGLAASERVAHGRVADLFDGSRRCRVPEEIRSRVPSVNTIAMAIPDSLVMGADLAKPSRKVRFCSLMIPGRQATYTATTEAEYFHGYQESRLSGSWARRGYS